MKWGRLRQLGFLKIIYQLLEFHPKFSPYACCLVAVLQLVEVQQVVEVLDFVADSGALLKIEFRCVLLIHHGREYLARRHFFYSFLISRTLGFDRLMLGF